MIGVARVTRAFLPLLVRAPHPRVVNVSSRAGSIAQKEDSRHYCYSASKAALNMLTRGMAAEVLVHGSTFELINARETFEQMIAGEKIPAFLK